LSRCRQRDPTKILPGPLHELIQIRRSRRNGTNNRDRPTPTQAFGRDSSLSSICNFNLVHLIAEKIEISDGRRKRKSAKEPSGTKGHSNRALPAVSCCCCVPAAGCLSIVSAAQHPSEEQLKLEVRLSGGRNRPKNSFISSQFNSKRVNTRAPEQGRQKERDGCWRWNRLSTNRHTRAAHDTVTSLHQYLSPLPRVAAVPNSDRISWTGQSEETARNGKQGDDLEIQMMSKAAGFGRPLSCC
jgi:hypothetical protein